MDAATPQTGPEKVDRSHIAVLSGSPLFGGLQGSVLARLLEHCRFLRKEAGEYFYREGDQGQSMYLLEKGRVAITKSWGKRELELRRLEAGECFGEVALVDFGPRAASVKAVAPCAVVEVPLAALQRLYEIDPEQYTLVQMNIARELSRRLRDADERLFRHVAEGRIEDELEGLCSG